MPQRPPLLPSGISSPLCSFTFMATSSSTPLTNSLAHKLADFACTLEYAHLGKNAVHEVKRRLIDSLGCALGAWNEEPCTIARGLATEFSAKSGRDGDRHIAQGAAGLGGVREWLLHPLFRLQRHLSLEGAGASERQFVGRARSRRGARRDGPGDHHGGGDRV